MYALCRLERHQFATFMDPRYNAPGSLAEKNPKAAKEVLISKLEEGFHRRRSTHVSTYSYMEQAGSSDTDDSVREIDEEAATWNQLLRSSSD